MLCRLTFALLTLAGAAFAQLGGIEPGKPFPDRVLPDLDGLPRSLADFRGKPVLLHVFASW